jgi:signal transduction histidine kinase
MTFRDLIRPSVLAETAPEDASALAGWRSRTMDILSAALALAYTPLVLTEVLGAGPPVTKAAAAGFALAYLVLCACAMSWRATFRVRLWLYGGAAYLSVGTASLALPQGPLAQAGLIAVPVVITVLGGAYSGRLAALASTVLAAGAPLLRAWPDAAALLIHPSNRAAMPRGWIPVGVTLAILIAQTILLDRYHHFLLRTMAAARQSSANLEREAGERCRLEHEVAVISDQERQRLGHDVHDGVCQQLAAALLRSQALETRHERGEAPATQDWRTLNALLSATLEEAHNVALGLCPLDSDPGALASALRELAARVRTSAAIGCEFKSSGNVEVRDPETAQHLYRIAQEAVSNAVRHAKARGILIELRDCGNDLELWVEDDGSGLPSVIPAGGMGLRTIRNRARLLGGELTIGPASFSGVRIVCRVARGGPAWPVPGDPDAS